MEGDEIIGASDSRFRQEIPSDIQGNAYGTVLVRRRVREGFNIFTTMPIICGHGGSMWLCSCCADNLLKNGWSKKCQDHRHIEQLKDFMRSSFRIVDGNPMVCMTATFNGMLDQENVNQAMKELAQEMRPR